MHYKKLFTLLFTLICTALITSPAQAENSQDFGKYVVHFNALNTSTLPPQVTRQYGIKRSNNRGMLNITVLKKVLGTTGTPVAAKIIASATNLTGQQRDLAIKDIKEPNARYYIAEFGISNQETLRFKLLITPEGETEALDVRYTHQFYTN